MSERVENAFLSAVQELMRRKIAPLERDAWSRPGIEVER